ncbi:MAG: dihydrofolate reductase [Coriobacteriia bacterium]|nr:dihydrofolate reductase [Coriobacteriia bacterium]
MPNLVYIATSIDGFIADAEGGIDWLTQIPNPDGSDYGFAEFMSGVDAVVMGRVTFETVATFSDWPYDKPVFVLSSTLGSVPAELFGRAEILSGTPARVVELLRARGFDRLYIDGGRTIQGFLAQDLIDEMTITWVPVLLGGGVALFGELARPLWFAHTGSEELGAGFTKHHYRRDRGSAKD